jgi:uncharacterized protein YgfB (UPF0149 family)
MRGKTEYQDEASRRMIYACNLAAWANNFLGGAGLAAPLPLAVEAPRAATLLGA